MHDATKIQPFDMKNIPLILDVLVPLWSPPVGDAEFKRFNVEYIVRNNIFENEYNYQLVDGNGTLLAALFFARKGDKTRAAEWFAKSSARFSDKLKHASGMSRTYIELMDSRTFGCMNDDDIKLSLFVSIKRGCGATLLDAVCGQLREQGWKNLYLWTDCDCNWHWYETHGYSLVRQDVYEPFSDEHEYLTYVFKKQIIEQPDIKINYRLAEKSDLDEICSLIKSAINERVDQSGRTGDASYLEHRPGLCQ